MHVRELDLLKAVLWVVRVLRDGEDGDARRQVRDAEAGDLVAAWATGLLGVVLAGVVRRRRPVVAPHAQVAFPAALVLLLAWWRYEQHVAGRSVTPTRVVPRPAR